MVGEAKRRRIAAAKGIGKSAVEIDAADYPKIVGSGYWEVMRRLCCTMLTVEDLPTTCLRIRELPLLSSAAASGNARSYRSWRDE